ncbi:TIR domain-containing protein [uncultured Lacinutrix sp.]|uniref:TIR domain-containing protein n=1 Tax=uncultured Lacinutrix sp. TaxID=574032 RepID=UPI002615C84D|nr:TIR domain-containing protein [uncultured Lacinutrix sp.]
MGLYTSKYLKNLASNSQSFVNESKRTFSNKPINKTERFDIFLSHSFLDKDEVYGIYIELSNRGYKVYVDWIVDSHLNRNKVTKESAELVRNRLKYSKTLLLALSPSASMSKWIPWELGYVDGNTNSCAIFPITRETYGEKTFKRSEYLLLYPYIKLASLDGLSDRIYTVESSYSYVDFGNWVKNNRQPDFNYKNINIL